MKASSRHRYLQRIDRVVVRLSSAIADEAALPSVGDLARDANLSEFHFMRIYRALAGEPLGATIQRLRLSRALHLLTQSSASVSEVAARIGFDTPQAFARAFRQAVGCSPSEARDRSRDTKLEIPGPRQAAPAASAIRVEVVELQPFRAVALRNVGAYEDLDRAYSRLFAWLADRGAIETVRGIWGVPHHDRRDTPASECVFDCCLSTPATVAPDESVTVMQLGGGQYARYTHTGSYALLDEVHDRLLRNALPARGLALRDEPILHEFLNDPDETPEARLETRIHLPVAQHGDDVAHRGPA
ncbi:MAG TPA: GyrI-like domain-containing protein [Steroidobacteraceae bacterium]|jgi:AraC family transcriptional regulator|nr:GyrI-like domain-containing protein [Steroidobacteraceae bacterium]